MVKTGRVELIVDGITAGGDGIARLDSGRVVFVPRTAPGDRVIAELREDRARWARAEVIELLGEGEARVPAPCPYFGACGGCRMQHLETATQTSSLARGVEDALARIGKREVPVRPMAPAKRRFGYRNRVTLTLRRRNGRVVAGYHRPRGPELIDVEDCPLGEPAVRAAWRGLRAAWGPGAERLPRGRELRITVRGTAAGDVALRIEGGDAPGDPDALLAAVPSLQGYAWVDASGRRHLLGGSRLLRDEWEGREVHLGPGAFVRVNRVVFGEVERHLDEGLGDVESLRILDLYAGIGNRSVRWAEAGARPVAVELEPDAVEAAVRLAEDAGVEIEFRRGRVEDEIRHLLPADIVVINPPRAGLAPDVCERLAEGGASRLVYVSCDPATLGRDLRRLGDAWSPAFAQPFDAFPQTGHVETVLWLDAARGSA
ncbi:MAG: TRAM domain-containing protein [Gemmatimonadota bacterium]|nr:TRAM domain-containing protein [Gemmatimonadota bacterium]